MTTRKELIIKKYIELQKELNEAFSFEEQNYKFTSRYKYGDWDGRIRMFNVVKKEFPIGLLGDLIRWLQLNKLNFEFTNHFYVLF